MRTIISLLIIALLALSCDSSDTNPAGGDPGKLAGFTKMGFFLYTAGYKTDESGYGSVIKYSVPHASPEIWTGSFTGNEFRVDIAQTVFPSYYSTYTISGTMTAKYDAENDMVTEMKLELNYTNRYGDTYKEVYGVKDLPFYEEKSNGYWYSVNGSTVEDHLTAYQYEYNNEEGPWERISYFGSDEYSSVDVFFIR